MDMEPLKIKIEDNYNWDDIICINDFDEDSLEIIKRESKIDQKRESKKTFLFCY